MRKKSSKSRIQDPDPDPHWPMRIRGSGSGSDPHRFDADPKHCKKDFISKMIINYQCFGSGSVSDDTDPDPDIAPKTNQNHAIKKSKLSVNT